MSQCEAWTRRGAGDDQVSPRPPCAMPQPRESYNILKCKPPCFNLELVVSFAYQPQYLAIEL